MVWKWILGWKCKRWVPVFVPLWAWTVFILIRETNGLSAIVTRANAHIIRPNSDRGIFVGTECSINRHFVCNESEWGSDWKQSTVLGCQALHLLIARLQSFKLFCFEWFNSLVCLSRRRNIWELHSLIFSECYFLFFLIFFPHRLSVCWLDIF